MRLAAAIPKMNVWREDRVHPVLGDELRRDAARARARRRRSRARPASCVRVDAHAALPNSPCGRKASTSAISTNVRTIEYCVQQSVPGRRAGTRPRTRRRGRRGATRRRRRTSDPMPPMITTTSELSSHYAVLALRDVALRGADDGAERDERRADDERDREGHLDVDPERRGHLPVVDARANDHPGLRPVEPEPERDADRDPEREHQRAARASTATPQTWRSTSRFVQPGQARPTALPPNRLRALGDVPREVRDHLVGDDHRDGDRDQRLAEVLALVPAEQQLLHDQAEDRDHAHATSSGSTHSQVFTSLACSEKPCAGHPLLDLVRDVAAEEVEGAVGHVDDAHQPEDQREAARDDEEQAGERERVEQREEERAGVVDRRAEVRRPPVARRPRSTGRRSRGRRAARRGSPQRAMPSGIGCERGVCRSRSVTRRSTKPMARAFAAAVWMAGAPRPRGA